MKIRNEFLKDANNGVIMDCKTDLDCRFNLDLFDKYGA